jgi:hypothetical protein
VLYNIVHCGPMDCIYTFCAERHSVLMGGCVRIDGTSWSKRCTNGTGNVEVPSGPIYEWTKIAWLGDVSLPGWTGPEVPVQGPGVPLVGPGVPRLGLEVPLLLGLLVPRVLAQFNWIV